MIGFIARSGFTAFMMTLAFIFDRAKKICEPETLGWNVCDFCSIFCSISSVIMFMITMILFAVWACSL